MIPCDLTKILVILLAATAQAALSGSSKTMTCWTSQCPCVFCGAVAVSEHLLASRGSDAPLTVELLYYLGKGIGFTSRFVCIKPQNLSGLTEVSALISK